MSKLQKDFDNIIKTVYRKLFQDKIIVPMVVKNTIHLGSSAIVKKGELKDVYSDGTLMYRNVWSNRTALILANVLATEKVVSCTELFNLYKKDQEYQRALNEMSDFKYRCDQYMKQGDCDQFDIFYARYQAAKIKVKNNRNQLSSLIGQQENLINTTLKLGIST